MLKADCRQEEFVDFVLPFGGKLTADNRWIRLSKMIPWDEIRAYYEGNLDAAHGAPSLDGRIAFGALLIKEKLGLTDREVVEQIAENPYLQYFIGYERFTEQRAFDSSMMVHFRKRFSEDALAQINEKIIKEAQADKDEDDDEPSNGSKNQDTEQELQGNKGKLLLDATCAPADIRYPTDLNLLNEARQKSEGIFDALFVPWIGQRRKPRSYRKKARKAYLNVIHNRRVGSQKMRNAIGKQLAYLKRNLGHIDHLLDQSQQSMNLLSPKQLRQLWIIRELYNQQQFMYENRTHQHPDRIVSISQPQVRVMVRGKARSDVEFGAKLSLSYHENYCWVDRISWDAYNECNDLKAQVQAYKKRNGHYPEVVCVDKIYRTRSNRNWCNENGIRLSGRGPGRPKKNLQVNKVQQQQILEDERSRIPVEGKFGQAKRRFSLSLIMSKLPETSITSIMLTFIVINLERRFLLSMHCFVRLVQQCILSLQHNDTANEFMNLLKFDNFGSNETTEYSSFCG